MNIIPIGLAPNEAATKAREARDAMAKELRALADRCAVGEIDRFAIIATDGKQFITSAYGSKLDTSALTNLLNAWAIARMQAA